MPKHTDRFTKKNKFNKKVSYGKYIIIVSVIVFLAGIVYTTIETATNGAELVKLESTRVKLQEEKKVLVEKQILSNSLANISEKAKELGFEKPSSLVYLGSESQVAKLP